MNKSKVLFVLILACASLQSMAQKKLVPVNQSILTSILLPTGSRQDSRFLSEMTAKVLLEMETKKNGMLIGKTELLTIPGTPEFQLTIDSLKIRLQEAGWLLSPVQSGDEHYTWIDRNNIRLICYLRGSKKEISLYFGEIQVPDNTTPQQLYPQQTDPTQNQLIQKITSK